MTPTCPWCDHAEPPTEPAYVAHDNLAEHYAAAHSRKQRCGCQCVDGEMWTCDDHAPAYLRERTAWRITNHEGHRYAATPLTTQPSLFAGGAA